MNDENNSLSEQLILGEALLEKYFGQDKVLFDQITMEEESHNNRVLKENRGPLSSNIQEKVENLNRFLLAVGYTPKQVIEQHSDQEAALESAIQLIYELIQREQKQKKQQEEWLLSFQQLETKYKHTQRWVEKLQRRIEEKDKQYHVAKTKDERQIRELEQQLQKCMEECTEWKIKTANWEQLQLQFGFELRKKDNEYQRLQQKLQQIMQQHSKVGNNRKGENGISLYGRQLQSSLESKGLCGEDWLEKEAYHMIETCFQDRIQKLQRDNESLQNFIHEIYQKMESKLCYESTHTQNSEWEDEEHAHTPLRWKLELPFEEAKEDIQKYFDEKLDQLLSMGTLLWKKQEIQKTSKRNENQDGSQLASQVAIVHSNESTLYSKDGWKEQNGQSSDEFIYQMEPKDDSLSAFVEDKDESSLHNLNESQETDNIYIPNVERCTLDEANADEEENLDDYLG
ncbi:hypothetical protein Gasu2_63620 [Galdieria sulphuraria]|nr:hypothetical protein Gasu2_63620 [Galdieria sulphuraria]